MLAIFLSERMNTFYQIIASFPTALFTFVLALCVLYWLLAVIGVVDLDVLDLDGLDMEGLQTDPGSVEAASTANALAGVMLKIGLHGVPVTIIVSFLALFGWLLSYYSVYLLRTLVGDGWLHYLSGVVILLAAFWIAVLITAGIVRLLRPFFQKVEQQTIKRIMGQLATVRSSIVTESFGEAVLNDGGAGLILKVRARKDQTFKKGDQVVLLEYVQAENIYKVIPPEEFHA